jgi:Cu+-exporting ATPase
MWFSWLLTILVLILMLPAMFFGTYVFGHHTDAWLMFLLSLVAMIFPARSVYVSAYKSVKSGGANMDVLIAIGTIASLLVAPSLIVKDIFRIVLLECRNDYFFHLTGRYVEAKAKARPRSIKNLSVRSQNSSYLGNGQEKEIPIAQLKVGDAFIVKPGPKFPDGIIIKGNSRWMNLWHRESMPVAKNPRKCVRRYNKPGDI